ncbi:hypothetical protein [Allobacillus halotolerans]|uniref:Zinc ribbon domain-containing protein n=1 Tax=Allobacillus halotolerans TaxID=570278 RepID=A0ABS6GQ30_9BACI|nr:hypothetical protein [Allobacillus halotolerans]MBU6080996.1 hypothetical protein [Allobacillus halotolerans]
MHRCHVCKNEQVHGNFCENCGTPLASNHATAQVHNQRDEVAATHAANTAKQAPVNFHQHTYSNEFGAILKDPTLALKRTDKQFLYGITTVAIFAILIALAFYFWMNGMYREHSGGWGYEPESLPFFDIFSRSFIGVALFLGAGLIATVAPLAFTQKKVSIPTITTQYCLLAVPFVLVGIVSMFAGLGGDETFQAIMVSVPVALFITAAPVIVVTHHLSKQNGQYVYAALFSVALVSFITYFLFNNYLMDLFEHLTYF